MTRLILDITDKNVGSFLDLAKTLKYIKNIKLDSKNENSDEQLVKDIEAAVEELKLIKSGKKEAKSARELFNEL